MSYIERSLIYNMLQLTTDKFGVLKHDIESVMHSMLNDLPSSDVVEIPEGMSRDEAEKRLKSKVFSKRSVDGKVTEVIELIKQASVKHYRESDNSSWSTINTDVVIDILERYFGGDGL